MIHRIVLENFMNTDYEDHILHDPKNPHRKFVQITGGHRSGRTRLLQAICFALAGQDISGNIRPHHLISEGHSVAIVRAYLDHRKIIERSIIRTTRKVEVKVRHGCATVATNGVSTEDVLGLSRHAIMSAIVPGYFPLKCHSRRNQIYDEVFRGASLLLPGGVQIQRFFECRIIDKKGNPYIEFSPELRYAVDFGICCAIHRCNHNSLGLILVDDYDPVGSRYMEEIDSTLSQIQMITTRWVKGMPLEVRV